jgi:hypothetical protein
MTLTLDDSLLIDDEGSFLLVLSFKGAENVHFILDTVDIDPEVHRL